MSVARPLLVLRFRKSYARFDLELDVELPPGIVAVFGPSGSGKSTTLNCIAGLAQPDRGEVVLDGQALFSSGAGVSLPPERRRLGYVAQEGLLFPHMTVRENIWYGYRLTPLAERRVDPGELVGLLELGPLLESRPASLSGGERQRVALARAVATSPRALLLDEPLASVDLPFRGRILRYLAELSRGMGLPMVYVSHSLSEVLSLAAWVLVLDRGRQVAMDAPYRLLEQPAVHRLLEPRGLESFLEVEVVDRLPESGLTLARVGNATLVLPRVEEPVGARLSVAVRAADVMLATGVPEGVSARNVLRATVEAVERMGEVVVVRVDIGVPLLAEVTPEAQEALGLRPGMEIYLLVKTHAFMPMG